MCMDEWLPNTIVRLTMSSTTEKPERSKSTTPSEERGERIDTAKIIESGGKETDTAPGATPKKQDHCDDGKQKECDRPPS